ncbi:MAG: phosphoribosylformylglycinamidine synthase subunit PurQ [Candidatus Hydrogenedentes bacterium]|nr:phosphoribosylformylglycinamidine synthase subunit PurQ [Candidatus Hydrogenedentota bacterium]
MTINVVVLTGFGINADEETQRAFNRVGAQASRIHLNDLLADPSLLDRAHILAIPGGFSFGDAAGPGKILANRLRFKLEKALQDFVGRGKLAIGISNGFQVMLRLGMLPFFDGSFQQTCTLSQNDSARFENRWVHLRRPENTRCLWLHEVESLDLPLRCEHGKFIPQDESVL